MDEYRFSQSFVYSISRSVLENLRGFVCFEELLGLVRDFYSGFNNELVVGELFISLSYLFV